MSMDRERETKRVLYHLKHAQWLKLPATLTVEQWLARINQFNGLCAYCLELPFEALDHLIPSTAKGGTIDGSRKFWNDDVDIQSGEQWKPIEAVDIDELQEKMKVFK